MEEAWWWLSIFLVGAQVSVGFYGACKKNATAGNYKKI